jgi:tetratricopeptide (TPR) repeat protein/2-polyprenyl-3-methyl-5-hydroxy-6-metoxy-1,4-benzoquinol methylase
MDYKPHGADQKHLRPSMYDSARHLFLEAMAHYQNARLREAEQLCHKILLVHPHNADSLHLLGLIARRTGHNDVCVDLIRKAIGLDASIASYHFNLGLALMDQRKRDEAAACYRKAIHLKPDYVRAHLNLGNTLRELGRPEEAMSSYRSALALNPDYAEAHNNLGSVLWEQGKLEEAAASFRRAILLKPDFAEAYNNLGNALQDQEQFVEAAAAYRGALTLCPDFAAAHNNLGNALGKVGDVDEAIACYRRALALEPTYAVAYNNLGNALKERGELDEAVTSYYRALSLSPDFAEAYFNLARALREQDKLAEAETSLRQGLRIRPNSVDALNNLASILMMQQRLVPAFDAVRQSLRLKETEDAKRIFVNCIKHSDWRSNVGELRTLIVRALTDPWDRPSDLAQTCARFLKQDPVIGPCIARAVDTWPKRLPANMLFGPSGPAALMANPLFEALLCIAPNADMGMERFLTMARRLLLEAARTGTEASAALGFYSVLARQCFINEYVFCPTAAEIEAARELRESLSESLNSARLVPAFHVLAVAAYFPLYSLPHAPRLLESTWPEPVMAALVQQIQQPEEERRLRTGIPRLTDIKDRTSKLVQSQYEENPYPRWIKAAPAERANGIAGYLHQKFPLSVLQPFSEKRGLEILVAGCGTGQHSIETAQCFPEAKILAIDLSASSLSYASHKTRELGIASIEYAQADIMELGGLGRRFDLVESVGVLHHLRDPFAGWQVLLSLLAPDGFMRLGLYSETARQNIRKARAFFAERGYGPSADEIRQARQDIAAWGNRATAESIINSPDFFSVSSCRDLIFHAQEHSVILAEIDTFLKNNDLAFLGFDLDGGVIDAYRKRFPHDPAAINLDQWEIFENDHPATFVGMYQFWARRTS